MPHDNQVARASGVAKGDSACMTDAQGTGIVTAPGNGRVRERYRTRGTNKVGWLALALIGLGLCFLVALTIVRVSQDADRAARRAHRKLDPFEEATTTTTGT